MTVLHHASCLVAPESPTFRIDGATLKNMAPEDAQPANNSLAKTDTKKLDGYSPCLT